MRRGLISWSEEELPRAVLDARVAALQAVMTREGYDAVVAYTTPARAAAVSWLAGFVPYWNQGLLVVPRQGQPVLVSALSNRVNGWMRRNAYVADVRNSPRIGSETGKLVAGWSGSARIGIVDLPHLPAVVVDDMAAEGHTVSDASATFREVRVISDAADLALYEKAAGIAAAAFRAIDANVRDAGRMLARVDGEARRLGAEEVYPALATDLSRSRALVRIEGPAELGALWALRLSVAYKGAWVRMTRTIARDEAHLAAITAVEIGFRSMVGSLPDLSELERSRAWLVEGTRTALPLEPLAGSMFPEVEPLQPGSVVTVGVTLDVDGIGILAAAPVLIGSPSRLLTE